MDREIITIPGVNNQQLVEAMQRSIEVLKEKMKEHPGYYEKIRASIEDALKIKPASYAHFLNWMLYEKYAQLNLPDVFMIKIKEAHFVEYQNFIDDVMHGRQPEPFWFDDRDDEFYIYKNKIEKAKYKQKGKVTNYEIIYAHKFKVDVGIEKSMGSGDWAAIGGQAMKTAYYTTLPTHKTYEKPDDKNINNILFLLNDFPNAQKLAEEELDPL